MKKRKINKPIVKFQMIEYQKKINQLRMLRAGLDERTIVDAVQKIASHSSLSVIDVLTKLIVLIQLKNAV